MARVNPIFQSPLINKPVRNGSIASYFPPSNPKPKPTVVSIPVRFVGSETTSKKKIDSSVAAMKIQRIFRGFLVRKNMKIVREIEADVHEIEKKFGADREMDLIIGDAKERLRINEMLMRLLFRLDSVRGVRDYRKRVIRRVILIQETLDSISAAGSVDRKRSEVESKNGTLEAHQDEKPDLEMADLISAVGSDDRNQFKVDPVTLAVGSADSMEIPQGSEPEVKDAEVGTIEHDDEALKTEDLKPENEVQIPTGWELLEANDPLPAEEDNKEIVKKESESEKLKEVMERMVAENEKLKGLVVELCQRSAQQCVLMGGLVERVEHLEKVVQKMEKKNKKMRMEGASLPACTVDKKWGGNRTS